MNTTATQTPVAAATSATTENRILGFIRASGSQGLSTTDLHSRCSPTVNETLLRFLMILTEAKKVKTNSEGLWIPVNRETVPFSQIRCDEEYETSDHRGWKIDLKTAPLWKNLGDGPANVIVTKVLSQENPCKLEVGQHGHIRDVQIVIVIR